MTQLTGFMHGINLGGWLSQCNYAKKHLDSFITENDIKTISEWKLDHIRLPVDYNIFQKDDGSFLEDGFTYVQNCIDWCKKYKLNIILDLHKTCGFSFDLQEKEIGFFESEKLQEMFYLLWEEFSRRYGDYKNMICFELLNEVTDQKYITSWNKIAKTCIKRIRKIAPEIKILVGSYWNNSVSAVKDLDSPYDENIIYNFHCYEPLIFTHQGALWLSKNMPKDFRFAFESDFSKYTEFTRKNISENHPVFDNFPQDASPANPEMQYFEKLFAEAIQVAEERNVLLYCGEYGVIDYATNEDIIKWYKLICEVFDKHNIGRAAWSYKRMNFGLVDSKLDSHRDELLKYL